MSEHTQTHSLNRCPCCGKPVPPNEWVSYLKCEDCWAGSPYQAPSLKPSTVHDMARNHGRVIRKELGR